MSYNIDFDKYVLVCRDCRNLWKPENDNFELECPKCKSNKVARQLNYENIPVDEDGVYIRDETVNSENHCNHLLTQYNNTDYKDW